MKNLDDVKLNALKEAVSMLDAPSFLATTELEVLYANGRAEVAISGAEKPDLLTTVFSRDRRAGIRRRLERGERFRVYVSPFSAESASFVFSPIRGDEGIIGALAIYLTPPAPSGATVEKFAAGRDSAVLEAAFRRPLGEVFANLAVVARRLEELGDKELYGYLDNINRSSYSMLRSWNNLAELMREFSGNMPEREPVDFWEEMSELSEACFAAVRGAGVELQYSFPQGQDSVVCHFPSIAKAVVNIVSNACHAAGENGHVTITGKRLTGSVAVSVEDDGAGMTGGELDKVFIPFYAQWQSDPGAGLSMPVSKQIIYTHGGNVTVSSQPGKGTTVTFSLPVEEMPPRQRLPLECGSARYLQDRYSVVHVGLCTVVPPPEA